MQDPIEIKGLWWLPEAEGKKLSGTLSYSQDDGAYLEVLGVFGVELTIQFDQPEIILGDTQEGKPITLYQCMKSHGTFPIMKMGDAKYRIKFVFEGVHFKTKVDIKFHQLFGSYTDLDAWVDIFGFKIDQENVDGQIVSKIEYEKPTPHFFDIDQDTQVGVSFASFGPKTSVIQSEVQISQRAYLLAKSMQDDVSFDDLFAKINSFTYLVQIAVQRVPYPISLIGLSHENEMARSDGEIYFPKINIYYQPIEAIRTQKQKIPHEFLFTFSDIEETHIQHWFQSYEKFETLIHLYRSLFFSDRLFIETRFLNIAQALESLHSILFDNQILPNNEFGTRKERVLQEVSGDLREWVKESLSNAN